ncbi:AI-2E family transporter [Kordiimonas gwangyangensis]|uniref:AI-2E family transporter n=1 Tax=Kordiimonas gwangyangensis TaxID=288022 RepID=UPI00037575B4|nr:AI-2E family transporter [Kordiimonas gwangyangensis]
MNKWFWIGGIAVTALFFYLTRGILLPFLAGLAVAYFLDPLADRLEARKVPRSAAAAIVITIFFLLILAVIIAFWPIMQSQIVAASKTLPETLATLKPKFNEWMDAIATRFNLDMPHDVDGLVSTFSDEILVKVREAATGAIKGSIAVFNILSLVLITPVVAFYLLRDWDRIIAKIDSWLPEPTAKTVREQAEKVDTVLAGFVRGQLLVSSCLGILYAVGWAIVGLDFAIVLGLLAGVMSFIPFVGALFAGVVAVAMAIGQWGFDPVNIALVIGVVLVVQTLEGSVISPKLVGDRVGLHPVWVLFAVFAGGEIAGFVGVLVAVPAAAAIAVLVRFYIDHYLDHYELQPKASVPQASEQPAHVIVESKDTDG